MDMLVAHSCSNQASSLLLPCSLKAQIRHYGRDNRIAGQFSLVLQQIAPEVENVVSINESALVIHGDRPIGISVKRKT